MTLARSIIFLLAVLLCIEVQAATQMSPFLQQQFAKARSLMQTESWSEAKAFLESLSVGNENGYAQAVIAQSLGQIAIYQDDMLGALAYFSRAYDLDKLDEVVNLRLLHNIAQLHCAVDEWVQCREKMLTWVEQAPKQARASDYLMIAQAYASTEHWSQVVDPASKALSSKARPPLAWHQLLVAAWSNLREWEHALSAQQRLLSQYPRLHEEWRRMAALCLQMENYAGALSAMRVLYESDGLSTEQEYLQFAQLLAHEDVPFMAAEVLQKGIDRKSVRVTADNLSILADYWLRARESGRALSVFEDLVVLNPSPKWFRRLALLHFQEKQWLEASRVLRESLSRQTEVELQLMLAIALTHMQDFHEAKELLGQISDDKTVQSRARNWLNYLEGLSV